MLKNMNLGSSKQLFCKTSNQSEETDFLHINCRVKENETRTSCTD